MSDYNVHVDRRKSELKITRGRIYLPYTEDGRLWNDLQRPRKGSLDGTLSAEAQDLVDFSTAIYHLDKLCPREQRESWTRKIHLKIGLRNPDRFRLIEGDLKWALSILGGDNFTFEVSRIRTRQPVRRRQSKMVRDWGELSEVALLSGGQDSFAGAGRILENEGSNPLFVRVKTKDKAHLDDIKRVLRQRFNKEPAYYAQSVAPLKDLDLEKTPSEKSQRLRSFYFLSLGAVLAQSHNLRDLSINENGIMAVHLPLDAARSSTFSTRTAYPKFLNLFESIVERWLDHRIEIRNEFVLQTKTEVVQECIRLGLGRHLNKTVSCAHSATIQGTVSRHSSKDYLMSDTAPDQHCGYCFPCLLRRVSMWKANLGDQDVQYATDPFKVLVDGSANDYEFVYEASSAVLGLIRLTQKFENPDFVTMLSEYPQIAECATVMDNGSMTAIVDMHQRFAQDVREYIRANASYLEFLFDSHRSLLLEQRVAAIASDEMLDEILSRAEVEASDAFYRQMKKLFDMLRLRVQVALSEGSMTEQQMRNTVESVVNSVVAGRTPPIKFTQNDGKELKDTLWHELRSRPCPPFW